MDNDLKCNRLTCRKSLTDKAVVTTCSHMFCVECANELFNASRSCPACDTALTEPDDVVVCSLNPTNDYKTSVLSGLSPATILEICSRAVSFWQYQMQQENSFQAAVVRNVNDKSVLLQKQLENVTREANGEIALLNDKMRELQCDLEAERRKVRELQESYREREKEYTKLKAQHDNIKRKTLLGQGPNQVAEGIDPNMFPKSIPGQVDMTIGSMNVNGTQRTPLITRTAGGLTAPVNIRGNWQQRVSMPNPMSQLQMSNRSTQRQAFNPLAQRAVDSRSYTSMSQQSESLNEVNEVENQLLGHMGPPRRKMKNVPLPPSWAHPSPASARGLETGLASSTRRVPGTFRPALITR